MLPAWCKKRAKLFVGWVHRARGSLVASQRVITVLYSAKLNDKC